MLQPNGPATALDELSPLFQPHHAADWPWFEHHPVPAQLPMTQSLGWLFVPDGRVVTLLDAHNRLFRLPGGTIEMTDDADPATALERRAAQEAQLALGPSHYLGFQYDGRGDIHGGIGPCARVRMAAPVTRIGHASAEPSSGRSMVRLLATLHQATGLIGCGKRGSQQADAAVRAAAALWGFPHSRARHIAEIPHCGGQL
ncbi:NUDIX hydrolase [Streptomyces lydicus]|uniref:hypothetical protein n=1 Tax=Streptomyces lydicus TaxID=47763 RepID=UPI0036E555D9